MANRAGAYRAYSWDDQLQQVLQEQFGPHLGASPIHLLSVIRSLQSCVVNALIDFYHNNATKYAAMKVVDPSTVEQAALKLAARQPLLRARDLKAQGIPTIALTRLVAAGKMERVGRGLYSSPGRAISAHRSLAEVALRVPRGVVCLLSALRVHEVGTQAPFEVWIAIPQRMASPRLDQPALRVIRTSDEALLEGVEPIMVDGVKVPVFNAAKTVADCFKYRNKIGLDVALEALHEGWRQRQFTMDELSHYAAINRVANVMRPYLESLTA